MKYQSYKGLIIWDIATISSATIILGMPWLRQANPSINWETGTVSIGTTPVGSHDKISTLAQIGIPAKYAEFKEVFREWAVDKALPEHQTWDHKIPIVPGKNPEKQPIYPISEVKLEVFWKYINENKAKGFIQESTSPVGSWSYLHRRRTAFNNYLSLPQVERNNNQEQLSTTTDIGAASPLAESKMVHQAWRTSSLPPDMDEGRGRVEDSFPHPLRTFRVLSNAIWTDQCASQFPGLH